MKYQCDSDGYVLSVGYEPPIYTTKPAGYPDGVEWLTPSQVLEIAAQFHDIPNYTRMWDEAKRCPFSRAKAPRYQVIDDVLTPTADVLDIDFDSNRWTLNQDGTVTQNA